VWNLCSSDQYLAVSLREIGFDNALNSNMKSEGTHLNVNNSKTTPFGITEILVVSEQPLVKRLILLNASGIIEFAPLYQLCTRNA